MSQNGTGGCTWYTDDPVYKAYHDTEWGVPEWDSRALWEKLILDGFQAGLSWITILRKRDAFREAFAGFDPLKVASFTQEDVDQLLSNPGIIRHRGKIEAAISNAQVWIEIEQEQGFDHYLWDYVGGAPIVNTYKTHAEVPTKDALSDMISKDLKKRGFKFCGPTIIYAFMEASGLINNHLTGCPRHAEVQQPLTKPPERACPGTAL